MRRKKRPLASVFDGRERALEIRMTDAPGVLISHLEGGLVLMLLLRVISGGCSRRIRVRIGVGVGIGIRVGVGIRVRIKVRIRVKVIGNDLLGSRIRV